MGRPIFSTLVFVIVLFVLQALVNYFTGVQNWFTDTVRIVIVTGMGYYFGYRQGQRNLSK